MSQSGIRGIDLFKIAGESISGWIPSWKLGGQKPTRQPFCSLMEERLLLYLEYQPQVVWYGRGDISATFASTYQIPTPQAVPFCIDYLFEGNAHVYLPDAIGQFQDGSLLIAEAGMEQDKRRARDQAKAEAARHPLRRCSAGSIGLAPKPPYSRNDMPISSFYMPDGNLFRLFKRWQRRY